MLHAAPSLEGIFRFERDRTCAEPNKGADIMTNYNSTLFKFINLYF